MKKLFFSLVLFVCVLFCACDNGHIVLDGVTYQLSSGEATVVRFSGGTTDIYIPDVVNGCSVVAIADGAFASAKALHSLSLPASLRQIGAYAFSQAVSLTNVEFRGQALKSISEGAFAACHSLAYIVLPQGLEEIGRQAFSDCRMLESVFLPGTLTKIGDRAFEQCQSLYTLQMPLRLTELGEYLFHGCPDTLTLTVFEGTAGQEYAQRYGIASQVEEN